MLYGGAQRPGKSVTSRATFPSAKLRFSVTHLTVKLLCSGLVAGDTSQEKNSIVRIQDVYNYQLLVSKPRF